MRYVTTTYKVELVSELWDIGGPLRSAEDVFHFAKTIYANLDADREHFIVIVQNNKNRVHGYKVVSSGTLTASLVHPREVLTAVLNPEWRAAAVILLHNHPSGDSAPSPEDIDITCRLKEIFDIMGIRLNDHIVLGHERFFSFSDKGML
jgi:DNA repair protein RadC